MLRGGLLHAVWKIAARYVEDCGMLCEEFLYAVWKIAVCYVKNRCT